MNVPWFSKNTTSPPGLRFTSNLDLKNSLTTRKKWKLHLSTDSSALIAISLSYIQRSDSILSVPALPVKCFHNIVEKKVEQNIPGQGSWEHCDFSSRYLSFLKLSTMMRSS